MFWWSQAEDGRPGKLVHVDRTSEHVRWTVVVEVNKRPKLLHLHAAHDGTFTCALPPVVAPASTS